MFFTDPSCVDAFQLNGRCYRVYRNDRVNWFTAINRCLSNKSSLAVFNDDDIGQNIPSSLLSDPAWIGLVKPWWTWPDVGKFHIEYIRYFILTL